MRGLEFDIDVIPAEDVVDRVETSLRRHMSSFKMTSRSSSDTDAREYCGHGGSTEWTLRLALKRGVRIACWPHEQLSDTLWEAIRKDILSMPRVAYMVLTPVSYGAHNRLRGTFAHKLLYTSPALASRKHRVQVASGHFFEDDVVDHAMLLVVPGYDEHTARAAAAQQIPITLRYLSYLTRAPAIQISEPTLSPVGSRAPHPEECLAFLESHGFATTSHDAAPGTPFSVLSTAPRALGIVRPEAETFLDACDRLPKVHEARLEDALYAYHRAWTLAAPDPWNAHYRDLNLAMTLWITIVEALSNEPGQDSAGAQRRVVEMAAAVAPQLSTRRVKELRKVRHEIAHNVRPRVPTLSLRGAPPFSHPDRRLLYPGCDEAHMLAERTILRFVTQNGADG